MAFANANRRACAAAARSNDLPGGSIAPIDKQKISGLQEPIIARLSSDDSCSAAGITVRGNAPTLASCRELLAAGLNTNQALEVYRGGLLALQVRSACEAAWLEVNSKGTDFVPFRAVRAASPIRRNEVAASQQGGRP